MLQTLSKNPHKNTMTLQILPYNFRCDHLRAGSRYDFQLLDGLGPRQRYGHNRKEKSESHWR